MVGPPKKKGQQLALPGRVGQYANMEALSSKALSLKH